MHAAAHAFEIQWHIFSQLCILEYASCECHWSTPSAWFEHLGYQICHNLSLGLATKARGCKVGSQEKDPGVTSHALGSAKNVKDKPSHSQVNSHVGNWNPKWTPKSLECDCRGQNPLPWRIFYINGNLLKCRCLKWACIAHLDIWNISNVQKKGRESNWQLDSRPLKVKNQSNFLVFRQRVTYHWKDFDKG